MLQIRNLTITHRKDLRPLLMNFNFTLNAGEKAAIIGEEGNGKSTLLMLIYGSVKYTPQEMEHPIREMSGGQKAKLLFLKLILDGANVLILDEPTRNFSPLSNPVIREILRAYHGAIISVSHDRKYMEEVCETIYGLTSEGLAPIWGNER